LLLILLLLHHLLAVVEFYLKEQKKSKQCGKKQVLDPAAATHCALGWYRLLSFQERDAKLDKVGAV
jgi:hypothetical protein